MDLDTLRVFDAIHNLKITEQEYENIQKEQQNTDYTGISIQAKKKSHYICIDHDEKHNIIITDMQEPPNEKIEPGNRILLKTLIKFDNLPPQFYTIHTITKYRALDTTIKHVARNIEEAKDKFLERFTDKYPKKLAEEYEERYASYDDIEKIKKKREELLKKQIAALYWMFGKNLNDKQTKIARPNVPRIVQVFQTNNNKRVAIIQEIENKNIRRGGIYPSQQWQQELKRTTIRIKTYTPRDQEYDYVNPGRELYTPDSWTKDKQIWLADDLHEKVNSEELKVLSQNVEEDWILLTADKYNEQKNAIRIDLMNAKRRENERQTKEKIDKKIETQFKKGEGKVTKNGIEITHNSITYGQTIFKANKLNEYIMWNNIMLQQNPDFSKIYSEYIDYILRTSHDYKTGKIKIEVEEGTTITIGNIKIKTEKKKNNIFINGHRICQDDVREALKNAITYTNQKKYDEWLKKVSRVNLTMQKILEQGAIAFELEADTTSDNCLIKTTKRFRLAFPITREKEKNYVIIDKQKYKVKNTPALLKIGEKFDKYRSRYGSLQRTIRFLYNSIEGVTPKQIGELIQNGRKEYIKLEKEQEKKERERKEKSQKFIEHAVKLTKAEKVEKGWWVKGQSGQIYMVTDKAKVYTLKDGKPHKYLCIIDMVTDISDQAGLNDAIAKRLLMLSDDKKICNEIYLRGDKMDTHWREISEDWDEDEFDEDGYDEFDDEDLEEE